MTYLIKRFVIYQIENIAIRIMMCYVKKKKPSVQRLARANKCFRSFDTVTG